jgi:hypothetical protein
LEDLMNLAQTTLNLISRSVKLSLSDLCRDQLQQSEIGDPPYNSSLHNV